MGERLKRLAAATRQANLDGVAVVPGASMRYLLGLDMHATTRLVVAFFPAEGAPAFVIPALELPRAEAVVGAGVRFYPWHDSDGPYGALERCVAELGLAGRRLGVEFSGMRVLELRGIEAAAAGVRIEDATPVIASLRMAKDADELAAMRAAVQIIEGALRTAIAQVQVGMTERELAHLWDHAIRAAGSEPAFSTIVASGPNAANPHHTNSDRALQPGDLVIMDGGARYGGYASDITRTVAIGEVGPELRRIYGLVQAANAAGQAAARPGASGEEIDRAARQVIEDGGYGGQFLHRTGHGLGIDIHESPYLVAGSRAPLPIGATFTIEPGIYLAGRGGVRIEDDVVITADGAESLTSFERELIVVA